MLESGKNNPIIKKAYEIAYAFWRIGINIQEKHLAEKIIHGGIDILGLAVDANYGKLLERIHGTEYLIKFGIDVNSIRQANGDILLREINNLKLMIGELNEVGWASGGVENQEADLLRIFSDFPEKDPEKESGSFKRKIDDSAKEETGNESSIRNGTNTLIKSEVRQSAILDKIREIGNCRLSDIQTILPECSERTIRYDLEYLVEQNIIEKVGTGGRAVYYRMRQENPSQTPQSRNEDDGNFYPPDTL